MNIYIWKMNIEYHISLYCTTPWSFFLLQFFALKIVCLSEVRSMHAEMFSNLPLLQRWRCASCNTLCAVTPLCIHSCQGDAPMIYWQHWRPVPPLLPLKFCEAVWSAWTGFSRSCNNLSGSHCKLAEANLPFLKFPFLFSFSALYLWQPVISFFLSENSGPFKTNIYAVAHRIMTYAM